jgi:hypothetical protein
MYTVQSGCARNCSADPGKASAAAGPLLRLRVPTRDWLVDLHRIAVTSTEGRHGGLGASDGEGPRSHRGKPRLVHPLTLSTSVPVPVPVPVPKNTTLVFGSRDQLCSPVGTKDQMRAVAHRRQSGHGSRRRQPRTDLAPWRPRPADSAAREVALRVALPSRRSGAVLGTDARVRVGGFERRPDPFLRHDVLTASLPQGDIGFLICCPAVETE